MKSESIKYPQLCARYRGQSSILSRIEINSAMSFKAKQSLPRTSLCRCSLREACLSPGACNRTHRIVETFGPHQLDCQLGDVTHPSSRRAAGGGGLTYLWLTPLTRQIAPPTKNGHAPPPIESRKIFNLSILTMSGPGKFPRVESN